jgi:tetratricopeptide (TPR) repeat protein
MEHSKSTARIAATLLIGAAFAVFIAATVLTLLGGGLICTGVEAASHQAITRLLEGDYAEALKCANRCVTDWPESHEGYLTRAVIHEACGNWEEAVADYSVVIALSLPDCPEDYYASRARAQNQLPNHEGAVRDYARAIQLLEADWSASGRSREHDVQHFDDVLRSVLSAPFGIDAPIEDGIALQRYLRKYREAAEDGALVDEACDVLAKLLAESPTREE